MKNAASSKATHRSGPAIIAAASILLAAAPAGAQTSVCRLVADAHDPDAKILRCGVTLTVRAANDTAFDFADRQGKPQPSELPLDSGALMVEFHPTRTHPTFQIRTPNAIAAVRGTKWVVDVVPAKTSAFVIAGRVAVSRPSGGQVALLRAGEGADVSPGSGPIVVKRWAAPRVRALLARFGR